MSAYIDNLSHISMGDCR